MSAKLDDPHSDDAAVRILDVPTASDIQRLEAPVSLPHLKALIQELFDIQLPASEKYGRSWQQSILRNKSFSVTSPSTGRSVSSADSLLVKSDIFYRFGSDQNLLLVSPYSKMGEGYPLAAIVCIAEGLLIRLGDPVWGVTSASVRGVFALLNDPRWRAPNPAKEVRLITGDMNFAHHIWNQLGALEHLAATLNLQETLAIDAMFQPLGPLAELLPELSTIQINAKGWRAFGENQPGRVYLFLGGSLVTESVRLRVRKVAQKRASAEWSDIAKQLSAQHRPTVWLSVRSSSRTPTNQREVMTALCRRIFSLHPRAAVILDGYSLPDDFATHSDYDRKSQSDVVARDMAEAKAIAEVVTADLRSPRQKLFVAVGLGVLDSIVLAGAADFYVCHHGTVQHKIGWIAAKPGVVHTNTRALRGNPGQWVSDQMESPPLIAYVPERLIRDQADDPSLTIEDRSRYFENYQIIDVEEFAQFVMMKLSRVLKATPSRSRSGFWKLVSKLTFWRQ